MPRFANLGGRPQLVVDDRLIDLEKASGGGLPATFAELYARWDEVLDALSSVPVASGTPIGEATLGSPSPDPSQVFGIGLNYRLHAFESGLPLPETPLVFTKFPSSIAGPRAVVPVPTPQVDWEVEIAIVLGRCARGVAESDAWRHVAGVCLSQDISARDVQMTPPGSPQFSLGKSFENFLPMGPYLVTVDELTHPDDLPLACSLNGDEVQSSSTADLVFTVPQLIAHLSGIVELRPGDIILTGTPSGVGLGRSPQQFLAPGDVLVSWSDPLLGRMENRFTGPST